MLPLLLAFSAAVSLLAEDEPPGLLPLQHRLPWTVGGSTSLGRVVSGTLPGGMGRTVVVMQGERAVVVFDPMNLDDLWRIDEPLFDVAFASDGSGSGSEALYAVASDGAWRYRFDPLHAEAGFDGFVRDALTPPIPAGAVLLAGGDLNGDGQGDLVAVAADLLSLHPFVASGEQWLPLPPLLLPGGSAPRLVRDLRLIEWDGTAGAEFAVCSTWGLEIYDHAGFLLHSERCYDPDNYIAVVETPGADRVALLHRNLNGNQRWLTVSGADGWGPHIQLKDNAGLMLLTTGIAAGDWNGDGYDDLLLVHESSDDVRILINLATGPEDPNFDPDEASIIMPTSTGASPALSFNRSQPLFCDLDLGGRADAFVALGDRGVALCRPGEEQAQAAPTLHPVFVHVNFRLSAVSATCATAVAGDDCTLELFLRDEPQVWGIAPPYDDIEVIVWYQPHANPIEPINEPRYPFSVGHYVFENVSLDEVVDFSDGTSLPACKLTIPFPSVSYQAASVPGHHFSDPLSERYEWSDCYYVVVRLIHWTGPPQGSIPPSEVKQSFKAGLTANYGHTHTLYEYLKQRPGAWPTNVFDHVDCNVMLQIGGPLVGGLVPDTKIPPPPAEAPTIVHPAQVIPYGL